MKSKSNPLPPIVFNQMIEGALILLRQYMNTIENYYCESETRYEYSIVLGAGNRLVSMLKYGLRYKELLKEKKISRKDRHQDKWEVV